MSSTLVIVPCGQAKIWEQHPLQGSTSARNAYTGALFNLNRAYAERFGDTWLILSAKYGFIQPDFDIPGAYDVTFKRASTHPISTHTLRSQVRLLHLDQFELVVVLGGADYRRAAAQAFADFGVRLSYPTAGLPIGKAMQRLRAALSSGTPIEAADYPHPLRQSTEPPVHQRRAGA